jgi:uncharacterized protein (TIRG00374 family)
VHIHLNEFRDLLKIAANSENIILLIIMIGYVILFWYSNGLQLDNLMRPFKINLKLRESFGLSIITGLYNLITPFRGGAAVRAIYLKHKYNFSYAYFITTLSASYILIFLTGSVVGLISIFLVYTQQKIFNPIIFIFMTSILVIVISFLMISPKFKKSHNKILNQILKITNGWKTIRKNKKVLYNTIILALIQLILSAINIWTSYRIFEVELNISQAIFISAVYSISMILAITPGNLGIGDAIGIYSATVIGITLTQSLSATILQRAISFLVLFILGPIFSYILLKEHKNEKHTRR